MVNAQENIALLFSVSGIMSLLLLIVLEIVLGIDNIIFISITANQLPASKQQRARTIGLCLALVVRSLLLLLLCWGASLEGSLFHIGNFGISLRAFILLGGGVFLLFKTWKEIKHNVNGPEAEGKKKTKESFGAVVLEIVFIDIVFSFDSVITTVAVTTNYAIMISAVILSMVLMILFSRYVADFINKNAGIKTIALTFLLVISGLLVAESFVDMYNSSVTKEQYMAINKNYIYAGLAFALFNEYFNIKERKRKRTHHEQL